MFAIPPSTGKLNRASALISMYPINIIGYVLHFNTFNSSSSLSTNMMAS